MTFRFTVFTPTYNRAHTLYRVYNSLKQQTFRDFEWLIVDDGSTDATRELVGSWQAENLFPIHYVWQENAHKKVAYNRGVTEAKGEFFLTLDSDDEAVPEALETFNQVWNDIPDDEKNRFSAVTALCLNPSGKVVGDRFPTDILDSNSLETAFRYHLKGEKWGFQRTAVLREFPFPTDVVGYVPESIVWYRIARKYQTRYINIPLRIYHPGADSLMANLSSISARADGRALLARDILEHNWKFIRHNPQKIIKEAVAYTFFSKHLQATQPGKEWRLTGIVPNLLILLVWPVGVLKYLISIRTSRK